MIPSVSPTPPCSLCSPSFFGSKGCPLSRLPPPLCVFSGPLLCPFQVLCRVLLPANAGHGARLWWEGSSSEDTEGHPDDDPHRPLLLLLPLLPQTHAHQVRWEGEVSLKNQFQLLARSLSKASAGWFCQLCFKPLGSLVWNKVNDQRVGIPSQNPHIMHPLRGKGSRERTLKFPSLKPLPPQSFSTQRKLNSRLFTCPLCSSG